MFGQLSISGFISLEGDSTPGDVAVFHTVTSQGRVVGLVGGMSQIDERLARSADKILGPGETWGLSESIDDLGDVGTPFVWSRALEVGRQGHLRLTIVSDHLLGAGTERPLTVLIVGILITGLAARLVRDSRRRGRTDLEIEWLRRSSNDKDRFLAGVGHELRTPLTVVVGMLDLASDQDRNLDVHERAELLTTARAEAKEIARIVDDFVTAGRLSADALTFRSATNRPRHPRRQTDRLGPNRSAREVTTEAGLGTCLGDRLRITQILLNLLDNARRNARHVVKIVGRIDDRFVTVEVCNDGPAVPTERGATLFEPFSAVQPEGQPQPVGLGLSVSRALARRMGGDLVYQWREGLVGVLSLQPPARCPAGPAELARSAAASTARAQSRLPVSRLRYASGPMTYRCGSCGYYVRQMDGLLPRLQSSPNRSPKRPNPATAGCIAPEPVPLGKVSDGAEIRRTIGIGELDRVLGGGLVAGSVVLIGGEPGVGKSTLVLQAAMEIAESGGRSLVVTAEESAQQVGLRADRLAARAKAISVDSRDQVLAAGR